MSTRPTHRPARRRQKPSALARTVMITSILAVVGITSAFILKKPKETVAPRAAESSAVVTEPAQETKRPSGWTGSTRPPRTEAGKRTALEPRRADPVADRTPDAEIRPPRPRKLGGRIAPWGERVRAMRRGEIDPPPFPIDELERKRPKRKYENDELPDQPPMLMVFTHPPGMRLTVNGVVWGITPFVRSVSSTTLKLDVELSSPSYKSVRKALTPDDKGRFQLGVVMEPIEP